MLPTLAAALVALACVLAAGRRLAWAIAPTGLDPRLLVEAIGGEGGREASRRMQERLQGDPSLAWERDLFAAFDEPEGSNRDALVNEQLLDFEGRADRWIRVPRVCASIGTSAGLLFGSLALLQGLGDGDAGTGPAAGQGMDEALHAALSSALGAVALGIASTSFCVAVHVRAGKAARARRVAVDALVERLRCVCASPADGGERTA